MAGFELEIVRCESSELVVQALPDGSTAIFEVATRNVYSLNPSAAAAWEACVSPTTLSRLAAAMSRRLNAPVTEDLAHEAMSELAAVGLVRISPAGGPVTSRRAMLKQVAGVGIPVVLVLTGAEQRAYAQGAGSAPTTAPPVTTGFPPVTTSPPETTIPPGTTLPPGSFCVFKRVLPEGTLLEGAVFELRNAAGGVVATLTTDANGFAEATDVPPGTYTLVETVAPGGPYEPLQTGPVTISPNQQLCLDLSNIRPPS
jgi:uncharacterized surface anchored protein